MDFTLCNVALVREESKYFLYHLITKKSITVLTFAEYVDRFKWLFKYVNKYNCESVLSINVDSYKAFIVDSNHKSVIGNGSAISGKEIVPINKKNRLITFLAAIQSCISEYLESSKPMFERDYWTGKELKPDASEKANFDFRKISQPYMRKAAKEYLWFKLDSITQKAGAKILRNIIEFTCWLEEFDENILSFKSITRDVLEAYFLFLRSETEFSQYKININILTLCAMFEWGIVSENDLFPQNMIFLPEDYNFKTKRKTEFYSNEEIASLFKLAIPKLPKVYGRILLVLHHSGMRISEVLRMKKDALKERDGKYYLSNYMYKTHRYNNIPCTICS